MKSHDKRFLSEGVSVLGRSGALSNLYGLPASKKEPVSGWRLFLLRIKTRRALRNLTEAQLQDIGLSKTQALEEARRPFWQ